MNDKRVKRKFGTEASDPIGAIEMVGDPARGGIDYYKYPIGNLNSVLMWSGESHLVEDKARLQAAKGAAEVNMRAMEDPNWSPSDQIDGEKLGIAGEAGMAAWQAIKTLSTPAQVALGMTPEVDEYGLVSAQEMVNSLGKAYKGYDELAGNSILWRLSDEELGLSADDPQFYRLGRYGKPTASALAQVGLRAGFFAGEYIPSPSDLLHRSIDFASGRGWRAPRTIGASLFGKEGFKEGRGRLKPTRDLQSLIA